MAKLEKLKLKAEGPEERGTPELEQQVSERMTRQVSGTRAAENLQGTSLLQQRSEQSVQVACPHCGGSVILTVGEDSVQRCSPGTAATSTPTTMEGRTKGSTSSTSHNAVEDFLAKIENLLDGERYQWAADTLNGIHDGVKAKRYFTEKQAQAVANIEAAGLREKSYRKEWRDR